LGPEPDKESRTIEQYKRKYSFVCSGRDKHTVNHTKAYNFGRTITHIAQHINEQHGTNVVFKIQHDMVGCTPHIRCFTDDCAKSPVDIGLADDSLSTDISGLNHLYEAHGITCIGLTRPLLKIPEVTKLISNPEGRYLKRYVYPSTTTYPNKRAKKTVL
jgi:hypothetical protein